LLHYGSVPPARQLSESSLSQADRRYLPAGHAPGSGVGYPRELARIVTPAARLATLSNGQRRRRVSLSALRRPSEGTGTLLGPKVQSRSSAVSRGWPVERSFPRPPDSDRIPILVDQRLSSTRFTRRALSSRRNLARPVARWTRPRSFLQRCSSPRQAAASRLTRDCGQRFGNRKEISCNGKISYRSSTRS
jgi:hypothetical protein